MFLSAINSLRADLKRFKKTLKPIMREDKFHNPNNITPQQYGANEGWRLLTVEERSIPVLHKDAQYALEETLVGEPIWENRDFPYEKYTENDTYRTRAPLPVEAKENIWIKMSERKPVEA